MKPYMLKQIGRNVRRTGKMLFELLTHSPYATEVFHQLGHILYLGLVKRT